MGGRRRAGLDFEQRVQDHLSQRRAFCGVGARAQLVEQHQVPGRHLVHDGYDVGHVGGEGGQALLDGLLVANVRVHFLKGGKLRAHGPRNVQAALGHQGHEAQGFQGDGLAAGVGACDDQRGKLLTQPQGAGHHRVPGNERMPDAHQVDDAVLVHLGPHAVQFPAEHALGKYKIQMGQDG